MSNDTQGESFMNQGSIGKWLSAIMIACGLVTERVQAWTVAKSTSDQPYRVSGTDLLQQKVNSIETNAIVFYNEGSPNTLGVLTDGTTGPGNREAVVALGNGSITYWLDLPQSPSGYDITGLDSYTGWQDGGRVDQNYVVSFKKVGSGTFGNAITNSYPSNLKETRISLTDLNLEGIEAVKITFLSQENNGVGYKEFDLFGLPTTTNYTAAGFSGITAYAVSTDDLLQTASVVSNSTFAYYSESSWTNAFIPALTDGAFGSANKWLGTCGIVGGTLTYTLDTTNHPTGYTISALDAFTGWGDSSRDNQNFWVSFRKVGADTFGDAFPVCYTGTVMLTHVNVTNLNLTHVEAARFTFLTQENGGVGYKELDLSGAPPAYAEVTRRDSGSKVIASNDTSNVLIAEGTGTGGALTLDAPTTVIDTLTQGATEDVTVVEPAGRTLALNGLFLRPDAGGLAVTNGTLTGLQSPLVIGNASPNDLVLCAAVTNLAAAGVLLKTGSGVLTLGGTNCSPGGTEVAAGTLRLALGGSLGSGYVNVHDGTLQLDGGRVSPATSNAMRLCFINATLNQTAGTLSYGGYLQAQNTTLNLSGGTSYLSADALLGWGGTNTTAAVSGSHVADWKATRFSSGSVVLNLQSGGKLLTDRVYSSVGAAGTVNFDGGTLGVSGQNPTLSSGDWLGVAAGSLSLLVRNGGAVIDTDNGSVTIRRPFLCEGVSTGGLTKTGRNTLALMVTNAATPCTYVGDTAVLGGTLKLGPSAASLPTGTRLTVASDAMLDLDSASQTVGELNGGGRVVNFSSTNSVFTVGGANSSTNFAGQLEGALRLVKTGTGTLTLTGANTYSNGTQIVGGTLRLAPLPVAVVNAGFELPAMTTGECWGYLTSDGVTGGWKMSGNVGKDTGSGIARNGYPTNAPWVVLAPQGVQAGYLQGACYCYQTVTVQRASQYQLSFSAANRPRYTADNVDVLIDGVRVAAWTNSVFASGGVFQDFATNFYLTAGAHELRFQGTTPGGDTTTAIDHIRLVGADASAPGNLQTNSEVEIAADAALDLGATEQVIRNLSGSGLVTNGTIAVNGTIAPGGANTVGTLTLAAAASLRGTLLLDTALDGTCDRLKVQGSLDLTGLSLQLQDLNQLKNSTAYVIATCAPGGLKGPFTATNLGDKRAVCYDNATGQVLLVCRGTMFFIL